ncbi:MAG TPA: hypothetical protein DCG53_06140 [Syntrophus sp. (in: bacteria)]|nr:hypothetical protein [Syntrophus sp. (in: bacteria)]
MSPLIIISFFSHPGTDHAPFSGGKNKLGVDMARNKITTMGLQKRVEELIASGVTTSVGIANALQADGKKISQPTVCRYLKEVKDTRLQETQQIVQAHVQKTVPADLAALEEMEVQCLEWAREENGDFSHRLAAKHIFDKLDDWLKIIRDVEAMSAATIEERIQSRKTAVKEIIRQSIRFVVDELHMQKSRTNAMRMAANIIDLKLRYAGLIDGNKDGGIFFVDRERGDELIKDEKTGRLMVIPGGKN